MAIQRRKADVVIVGLGWAGSLMAEELTRAGLNVVAIERGRWLDTPTDTPPGVDPDELRWSVRRELLLPPDRYTITFRNTTSEVAVPLRSHGVVQLGNSTGGAGFHWAGMAWRFTEWDFRVRTATTERYGQKKLDPDELSLQDWGINYADLEPDYDRFEKIAGISGFAGNLGGAIRPGGNPFEAPRRNDFPTPPLKDSRLMELFRKGAQDLGWHPFTIPVANVGAAYTNPLGVSMAPCTYCGFCLFHGCGNYSKSSPQACVIPALMRRPNFTLITHGYVRRIEKSGNGRMATGVTYIDERGREIFQPADIVCVTSFTLDNTRLMLLSDIGKPYDPRTGQGTVGRNYNYQTVSGTDIWFEDEQLNPFMGAGGLGVQVDDYNGDVFDHADLDFIGGAGILTVSRDGMPISRAAALPPGIPRWGSGWKRAYKKYYRNYGTIFNQGTSMPARGAYLDLDPTFKDPWGVPLLRMTFDFNRNDRAMAAYTQQRALELARAMGAAHVAPYNSAATAWNPYDERSNHMQGGVVMGRDPATSVVNTHLQCWDMPNLFVVGASAFPNNAGYNPTSTVGALALRSARAIVRDYIGAQGRMVAA